MNAPPPALTSITSASREAANFLLRMLAVISGTDSTVPVTSRIAYRRRSAGAIRGLAATINAPTSRRTLEDASVSRSVRKPGIDSSLSSVPPVRPSPRPLIIGTSTPQAAKSGARTSETLSPSPPVLCLSTRGRSVIRGNRWPLSSIAAASVETSPASIPRAHTAIAIAAIW